jgi:hypothetical protein
MKRRGPGLSRPRPDTVLQIAIYGLHATPNLPLGRVFSVNLLLTSLQGNGV